MWVLEHHFFRPKQKQQKREKNNRREKLIGLEMEDFNMNNLKNLEVF